ncbi:short chain dehydrogenase [Xylariaceae sp. FL0804]|nr:short chain dehydrogenase [Xylariaceae sp. FL0804]
MASATTTTISNMPVALITAGSAGLGAASARLFAKSGYRVAVNYSSNAERAAGVVAELAGLAPADASNAKDDNDKKFVAVRADLGSRDDVRRLVDATVERLGRLDVVFSNGGWSRFRGLASIDDNCYEEEWDRAFNMNVKSHLWLMQAAKKHLEATEGVFISTSSLAGVTHSGSSLAYSVTKAAQLHLMKALAQMAAPKIRVNSVSPGLLLTEWADRFTPEQKDAHRMGTQLKRIVAVDDVADQVLGLARNRSMTGVNVVMDAGHSLK